MSNAGEPRVRPFIMRFDKPKCGTQVEHYEGKMEGDKLSLALRETRVFEPDYIPKAMAAFLTLFAMLEAEDQLLIMQLMLAMRAGQKCQLVDIDGRTYIHFPDPRGDARYDRFIDIVSHSSESKLPSKQTRKRAKTKPKSATKKRRET
jgi:hypothetical protein